MGQMRLYHSAMGCLVVYPNVCLRYELIYYSAILFYPRVTCISTYW